MNTKINKKFIIVLLFFNLFASYGQKKAPCSYSDIIDIAISTEQLTENSISIDPNKPNILLTANNSPNGVTAVYSTDWGNNWSSTLILPTGSCCDPSAGIDLHGFFYVLFLDNNNKQRIARSTDLGNSWQYTLLAGQTYDTDKGHLWIDNCCTSPYAGRIYASWNTRNPFTRIQFSYSTDLGSSWVEPIEIFYNGNASRESGVNLNSDKFGNVYLAWAEYIANTVTWNSIFFSKSANGGVTWQATPKLAVTGLDCYKVNSVGPSMCVNNTTNSIFLVLTPGEIGDIKYIVSWDFGDNWSNPTALNSASSSGRKQPWIACDAVTGALTCVYYDKRNGSTFDTYVSISLNDGVSWCDLRVSDISFNGAPSSDYIGVAVSKNLIYPLWCDDRSGLALTHFSPVSIVPRDYTIPDQTTYSTVTFTSANSITANNFTASNGSNVTFQTTNFITLQPGFDAVEGCVFNAKLLYCGINTGDVSKLSGFEFETLRKTRMKESLPLSNRLCQNYPNPFNPSTSINYVLQSDKMVSIKVFDITGRLVKVLVNGFETKGEKSIIWDGKNSFGDDVATGVYIYKLQCSDFTDVKKMVLIR